MASALLEKLICGKKVATVELNPPKSHDINEAYMEAQEYADLVDAINITDCPMASIRLGAIAVSHLIKTKFNVDTIFNLTCRDRNLIGLQSELLGARALGVNNILAITGDPPTLGQCKEATGVFDVDSVGLISLAKSLSSNNGSENSLFCVGTTVSPTSENWEKEFKKLQAKIDAGADFVITQPIYNIDIWQTFTEAISSLSVPVIVGILPLRSFKMAQYLNEKVPGIEVPKKIMNFMEGCKTQEEASQLGLQLAKDFVSQIKDKANGIHIMPMSEFWKVKEIVKVLRE